MKKVFNTISYDLYLVMMLVLTFLSYIGIFEEYLLPSFMVIGISLSLLKKEIIYIVPVAFFMQMSFSELRDNVTVTTMYVTVFTFLILFDAIRNRKFKQFGYLSLPLLIFIGLSMITHINNDDLFVTFAGWFSFLALFGLYYFFVNTLKKGEETFIKLSKLFMYMSLLVTIEMLYFIYNSDFTVIEVIQRRNIDLGWENLNIIIYVNLISIPLIAYLITKSKVKLPYMVIALFVILGIMITLSRSSILTVAVFVVFLIPTMFLLEKKKMSLIIQGLLFTALLSIGLYVLEQDAIISDYYLTLMERDVLNYEDRLALLKIAWENYKLHPIIGNGGIYSSRFLIAEAGLPAINYHNTIAQASTLGTLGLLSFIFLFYRKTKLMIKSTSDFKWFALILIYVTAFVNGMFQPMYFYTSYMVFTFMILASIETDTVMQSIREKQVKKV